MTKQFNLRVMVSPNVLMQTLDDEAVLLHLDKEYYYGLDDIGTRIWNACVEHGWLDIVVDILLQEYDVTPEQLRTDVLALVEAWSEHGLVRIQGG